LEIVSAGLSVIIRRDLEKSAARRAVNPRNFFAELKRRNVYKVAIAYGVVAWLLVQIATQVFPFFEIPNWTVRLIVLLIVIGFPIGLIIAWAFELTPEGLRRTEAADAAPTRHSAHRAWIYVVVVAGAISVGLFFLGRYTSSKQGEGGELPAKSIAVLPFENLSRDPDNAYFTEGIQEEILTRLAKIADLKVISRTSTQRFRSSPNNLPQIAKQLGVANILQGSVQKAADQVRVTVQLINATTDAHLWAESYDRKLTDIFTVESDIARTIADTLKAKLTGAEEQAIARRPTEVPEAYELYLKGRFFWSKRTGSDLRKAIDYFKQAIDKDPNYSLAYAGLADAYVLLPLYGAASSSDSFPQAEAAAKRALEIDDTLAEAHTSLAQVFLFYHLDFGSATREFERAIALNPNYATAHHWYGVGPPMSLGEFDKSIAELKRAQQLDPLSLIINSDLGAGFITARRYDDGIAQLRRTIEMDPHFYYAHWNLGEALELKGQLREAFAEYKKAAELDDDPLVLALLTQAYAKLGQRDEALKMLDQMQQLAARRYVPNYAFALVYIAFHEKEKAIDCLERAYRDRTGPDITSIKVDPMLDPLRGDQRFEALVEKVFGAKNSDAGLRERSP
jgi:TolB-like protein/Tfp pilus assembly protein PilF